MNKEEFIKRYGEVAYEKKLQRQRDYHVRHRKEDNIKTREWGLQHREEATANVKRWRKANPDKALKISREICGKGGKYYEKHLKGEQTGLRGERNLIRNKHHILYQTIKQATPNSVFHHEWIPGTAKYRGVASVDKEAHQNGIIKVIHILDGKITLLTEEEISEQGVVEEI